jgi:hypothetical protein
MMASSRPLSALRRIVRAVRLAAGDERIPRPLRWLAALGLLPIPGPVDEVILLVAAVPLVLFYRRQLVEAWHQANPTPSERLDAVPRVEAATLQSAAKPQAASDRDDDGDTDAPGRVDVTA